MNVHVYLTRTELIKEYTCDTFVVILINSLDHVKMDIIIKRGFVLNTYFVNWINRICSTNLDVYCNMFDVILHTN